LTDLDQRIQSKDNEYQTKLIDSLPLEQYKRDVNIDEQKRTTLQSNLKDYHRDIDNLHVHSKITTERDMFIREKAQRDEQIRKM
jgi:hypothetical protein